MKRTNLRAIFIFFSFSSVLLLSSCALVELGELGAVESLEGAGALTEAEMAGMSSADVALTRATLSEIFPDVLSGESSLNARLSEIRVIESFGQKPRLNINVGGINKTIAEVIDRRTLRLLEKGEYRSLPGDLYKVKGNGVKVRSSKFLDPNDYNVKYKLNDKEVVLVLSESNGWSTVWLGENKVGFVKAGIGLLVPIGIAANNSRNSVYQSCRTCNGTGSVWKNVSCLVCNNTGEIQCLRCRGAGKSLCKNCNGEGRFICRNCSGSKYFVCSNCGGHRYFLCQSCNGAGNVVDRSGVHKCYSCAGNGSTPCYACGQKGWTPCYTCGQTGYEHCFSCGQTGSAYCSACGGSGHINCNRCFGKGIIELKYLCSNCLGAGRVALFH